LSQRAEGSDFSDVSEGATLRGSDLSDVSD